MKRSLILLVLLTIFSGAAWSIWEFRHATIPVTDIDVMKKVEYKKHTNDEKIFWIDKYEVTNGQYWRWDESLDFPESKVDFPVTNIDWYQAMAYAKHVGKRLPSQEEWLIAAHATPEDEFNPWDSFTRIPYVPEAGSNHVYRAGKFWRDRTALGIANMSGNVWEWTADTLRLADSSLAAIVKGGFTYKKKKLYFTGIDKTDTVRVDEMRENLGFRCIRDKKK
ncbi:MAG: SUMF1/EgtB/PvdO family nonheme iron enzyme [Deferribacteres bacterium]|nr:SUMF1/EgtB/PvdO family nonheme iron enzyme [candidate division KSB1 bacterium]MCB9500517.1 SUMF1/EgtB/PvdO family nonheme iron enzyme [Deferribacteres bacterium]